MTVHRSCLDVPQYGTKCTVVYHGTQCTMVYHGTVKMYRDVPWYTMYHGIPRYTMVYHGIPWSVKMYHGIPRYFFISKYTRTMRYTLYKRPHRFECACVYKFFSLTFNLGHYHINVADAITIVQESTSKGSLRGHCSVISYNNEWKKVLEWQALFWDAGKVAMTHINFLLLLTLLRL